MSYQVAVRALCEFTAKVGDLDLRFTPSPTAQEGMAGHATVVARRGPEYLAEVPLSGEYRSLRVRGRADGYDPQANLLEEIKTHRGDISRIPDNHRQLHWAQAKVYGWLLCNEMQLTEIDLAVVYFNVLSQKESVFHERHQAQDLQQFFNQLCERFIVWAEQEVAHRKARDQALAAMTFPHAQFRLGQRQLAEAVYRAARDGHSLMAQATTGIGKTLGTLFPQLKAFAEQGLDRLFFLTAKTPGRRLALEALQTLRRSAGEAQPVRILEHVARDKACEHPDKACHGESCPLAKGFYDRLPAARQAALDRQWLDQQAVRETALTHQVCPYYLSQELSRWADVVVCDYNYYFDLNALLYSLTQINEWRVTVLVDEAHNLVERARSMYTAELSQASFGALRRIAPNALKGVLERVNRHWNQLHADQQLPYQVYPAAPDLFLMALQKAVSVITDHLTDQPTGNHGELLRFYLDAMLFCRLAEAFGPHSLFDISRHDSEQGRPLSTLCLRNLVPAPFLAPRFEAAHSTTLFSATLSPARYYADLLGLPAGTPWLDVQSPFHAEQLQVQAVRNLSTRYAHREQSLGPIASLMTRQYTEQPGNYLAFFSSYTYLEQVLAVFRARNPGVPVWVQSRQMDESQRQQFLDQFVRGGRGIGFAVLGGAFGEGIDLPGDRLIGAFIATLGLPQINPINQQVRERMQAMFGSGYDYTYLYPGLQKVVQAAGRVIRTLDDRGVVYLMDDRFTLPEVQRLLPSWWTVDNCNLPVEPPEQRATKLVSALPGQLF
ncbi:MAG: ATP-dependent DNA helicase [Gammaproteobacteria bacterium]|nr:ATP-dependent DNA helicase [Gammaproteobacteria bacterium]MBU1488621.1 ATP-dependent DNA helicase [Gammaproteobacteria bacterium]MBU2064746.1 ATP-dependent DNA helicase [Gammaproteobacteria bacterium]MBU2137963.1 ATP-dependent DNA helicase [Gammaproteobacteria bacterium]MBU2215103.1 ATP-dependent DNA helicase [Gammaproteobacteria bacterium]